MNFEEAIVKVDNLISLNNKDRESYSKDFDAIRNYLLEKMTETDPVFKAIYSGPSLFGSYLENLKIDNPDEFDLHFSLKLPFYEYIKIAKDSLRPGFVKLKLSKPLKLMEAETKHYIVYNTFRHFVNDRGFLYRSKIQTWLENIINKALINYGTSVDNAAGTDKYQLHYSKRGTAHTIRAFCKGRKISIDFVPAFRFNADYDWFAERPFPINVKEKIWFAVPKPSVGPKTGRKFTFSICVPQTEKELLIAKYNLKPTLRLLKSLRDRIDRNNVMKSYFIKSVYLHENDKQDDVFWMKPKGELLLHMLDRLLFCLDNQSIEFYWCPSMNLLASVDSMDLIKLRNRFQNARNHLNNLSQEPKVNFDKLRSLFGANFSTLKPDLA